MLAGKNLDDATFGDATVRTFLEHAAQFRLERSETTKPRFDADEMSSRDGVHLNTGAIWRIREPEEFPDDLDVKTQLACVSDEAESLDVFPPVAALVT